MKVTIWQTGLFLVIAAIVPLKAASDSPVSSGSVQTAQAGSRPEVESPVVRARELLDRLEGLTPAGTANPPPDEQQIKKAAAALQTYLDAHPEDVSALIASARMGWLIDLRTPRIHSAGDPLPNPGEAHAPMHKLLDRALTFSPESAEANYWKARLFGVVVADLSGKRMDYRPVDISQAIRFARRAVELAPLEIRYKETLALYLVQGQEAREAMDVLRDVQQGRHPMYLLLSDWNSLALPDGAILDSMQSKYMAQLQRERGVSAPYVGVPYLRVRAYIVTMTARDVETFFKQRWPAFRLREVKTERGARGIQTVSYGQFLRRTEAGWQPEPTPPNTPTTGISLFLAEVSKLDSEAWNKARETIPLPEAVADVFCNLLFVNMRP